MTSAALSLLLAACAAAAAPKQPAKQPAKLPAELSTDDRRRSLLLCDLLIDEKRLEEAEALVLPRVQAEPDAYDWGLRLARLRGAQQRHPEARAAYKKLLEKRPDDSGLWLAYGQQAQSEGDHDEARRAYLRSRALAKDARSSFHLAELHYGLGDSLPGRSYAKESLDLLRRPRDADEKRMSLRLRSRLGWSDELEREYGKLYEENPRDHETLSEWASALIRAGHLDAAREPVDLLRERFPKPEERWRLLELERLRASGDEKALADFVRESEAALPHEPSIRHAAAEIAMSARDWDAAQDAYAYLRAEKGYGRSADQGWVEAVRQGHHYAGPYVVTRQSVSTRALEEGLRYEGYPRRRWKLEAEASTAVAERLSNRSKSRLSGARVELAREQPRWRLGGDLDVRSGEGRSFFSPGILGDWRSREGLFDAGARAWLRRAATSVEALQAGAAGDVLQGRFFVRPLRRFSAGSAAVFTRFSLPDGSSARQSEVVPEAVATLFERPLYSALSYRYAAVDASGQDAFFRQLPLLRRSRIQYLTLSSGFQAQNGRLRGEAYVFNGHDPQNGRRFGSDALVGFGARLDWLVGRWRLTAGYDHTKEDTLGVGGRSDSAKLSVEYRWPPNRARPR